jgi:hypothetical protein
MSWYGRGNRVTMNMRFFLGMKFLGIEKHQGANAGAFGAVKSDGINSNIFGSTMMFNVESDERLFISCAGGEARRLVALYKHTQEQGIL